MSYKRHKAQSKTEQRGFIQNIWSSFWESPHAICPKCGNSATEFYDPFFFSPIRTLKGKRRLKCTSCHFIWRPSHHEKSLWEVLKLRRM